MNPVSQIGPFAVTPRWVLVALKGEPWAVMLYAILADKADRNTDEWMTSRKALAEEMGCSLFPFKQALKMLIDAGCISIESTTTPSGDQGWNRYKIHQIAPAQTEDGFSGPGMQGNPGRYADIPGSAGTHTTVTRTPINNPTLLPDKSSESDLFDEFWRMYPRKTAKQAAAKAFKAAVKRDSAKVVLAGLHWWVADWKREQTTQRYIPYPATFLNGGQHLTTGGETEVGSKPRIPPTYNDAKVFGETAAVREQRDGDPYDPDEFRNLCGQRDPAWIDAAVEAYRTLHQWDNP